MTTNVSQKEAISTHSLTRRLTLDRKTQDDRKSISTHSLTRRLTLHISGKDESENISTHSLTRRLTVHISKLLYLEIFQLTASQGG